MGKFLKILLFFIVVALFVGFLFFLTKEDNKKQSASILNKAFTEKKEDISVRKPKMAGQFYSANEKKLGLQIDNFIQKADSSDLNRKIKGLILPHAGYVFSGQVAAYGVKSLKDQKIERVILIGSSHNVLFKKVAIDGNDKWQTPLGEVDVDTKTRNELVQRTDLFNINKEAHKQEHSLEVEIPFLQKAIQNDFKILPILTGYDLKEEDLNKISLILKDYLDDKTIIIASSDLSHYPNYENANKVDLETINSILTGKTENLENTIKKNKNAPELATRLCGKEAVKILMKTMDGVVNDIKLLKYMNTGDVPIGDKSHVVGYSSIAFLSDALKNKKEPKKEEKLNFSINLNKEQEVTLLNIARESVESYIKEKNVPEFKINDNLLKRNFGVFVTLKKEKKLRGCVGVFDSDVPLYKTVSGMAIKAAVKDRRFVPVKESELSDLDYEISILSPLKKIDDWQKIEPGKHGVKVVKGNNSGVFLPQVATENNWNLEKFMNTLCEQKAGINPDAWKEDDTDLYVFTVYKLD